MLTFEQARQEVISQLSKIKRAAATVNLSVWDASGYVLAQNLIADRDYPPFDRATRDGYAVRASESTAGATLACIGEIRAGDALTEPLKRGTCIQIMTGAPVPPGADAVVMIEYTSRERDCVEITKQIASGENIVAQGAEANRGSLLLPRGLRLNEAAIALAASVGKSRLNVYIRPRVAVLATGDEIVDLDAEVGPTQIRNSNSYSLAVQVQEAGGEPVLLPVAPDEPHRLRQLIEQGLRADLLLMTGGVSMGRYDLVEQVLAEMRAEFFF